MKWEDFGIWFSRILSVVVIVLFCLWMFQKASTALGYIFAATITLILIHLWRYLFFKR